MTKNNNMKNRISLFILLLIYPVICKISTSVLTGFYNDFQMGATYWGKYVVVFIMAIYAIAGQYLIKKIVEEKWKTGIILTLIILIIYVCSIVLWLLPVNIQPLISFFTLMSRFEYTFVPVLLLVYTIVCLANHREKH